VRLLVAALFLVAFQDALSTYIVITLGHGVEANPAVAGIINSNPALVFPLAFISAAVLAVALYVAAWLSNKLPAKLRAAVARYLTWAVATAVVARVAVVVNNLAIIVS
jgi:hypothetical protein